MEGENRAQRAIEQAFNSPLLNDNDIRGAQWILININSSEGEYEYTMDEVEIIQNFILSRAGEHTDVILGLGYDHSLNAKIGITLIATGFEHKDPFAKIQPATEGPKKEEKVIMTLTTPGEQPQPGLWPALTSDVEENKTAAPTIEQTAVDLSEELQPKLVQEIETKPTSSPSELFTNEEIRKTTVEKKVDKTQQEERIEWVLSQSPVAMQEIKPAVKAEKIPRHLQCPGDILQDHPISMLKSLSHKKNPYRNTYRSGIKSLIPMLLIR